MKYRFIDLFAGAGGLSEGFIRAGYEPIAHIEMDHYACDSLKTRAAFHYLKENGKLEIYEEYLKNKKEKTDGSWLWNQVPKSVIDSVIQEAIGKETLYNPQIQISAESETKRSIFREKDKTKRSKKESAQHSKSRNKSFVMTSVSAL